MRVRYEKAAELETFTNGRVAKMKQEFKEPEITVFENTEKYDQLIAQVNIPFSTKCEHHEVAFHGFISVAYIPDKWLVGLSKIARIAEFYANPTVSTIQERITSQIASCVQETLVPQGVMVVIQAEHDCIAYRGVKKPSLTITSSITGVFKDTNKGARQEFLQLIGQHSQ